MSKIINNPDYLWEDQINSIFQLKDKDEVDIFFNIINLVLNISIKNTDLIKLYKLVGLDDFCKIINTFNGKDIKLIKSEQLKDAILLALFYYKREIKNLSWDEIKKEVPFEFDDAIKFGIKIKNMNEIIKKEINKLFNGEI